MTDGGFIPRPTVVLRPAMLGLDMTIIHKQSQDLERSFHRSSQCGSNNRFSVVRTPTFVGIQKLFSKPEISLRLVAKSGEALREIDGQWGQANERNYHGTD
jgi:hypothetical protein